MWFVEGMQETENLLQVSTVKRVWELSQVKKLISSQQGRATNSVDETSKETTQEEAEETWLREITVSALTTFAPEPLCKRQKSITCHSFQFSPKVCISLRLRHLQLVIECIGHTIISIYSGRQSFYHKLKLLCTLPFDIPLYCCCCLSVHVLHVHCMCL